MADDPVPPDEQPPSDPATLPDGKKEGTPPKDKKTSKQKTERVSFYRSDGVLGESTFAPARQPRVQYAVWKIGGEVCCYWDECPLTDGNVFVPPADKHGLISKGVVLLPSYATEYGAQNALLAEIIVFIHKYTDVPPFWEQLIAHYAFMTWVFDRFTAVPYLRFLGEPGSGKTRCLQVAGHLCYKSITGGGATTSSPLFRLLETYQGTFVIDEADYKHSDLSSEIIKILNSGYMRGMVVLRSEKNGDGYDPRAFDVFGPKILTTRREFADRALETRCLTLRTVDHQVRPDVPRQLPRAFETESLALRNKLLRWRFENLARIVADESKLLELEPRLTQIGTPLYSVSTDGNFRAELVKFLVKQADEHHAERPQAIVAEAIRQLLANVNKWPSPLAVKAVSEKANEVRQDWETDAEELTPKRTGGLVRSLGIEPHKTNTGYRFNVTKTKLAELVARYPPKFAQEGSE